MNTIIRKYWRTAIFYLLTLLVSQTALSQPALYVEGTHYTLLADNPLSRSQQTIDKPLVTEIFWYGCPSCYNFDPLLSHWVEQQGDSIAFQRSHTVWNSNTKRHATLFFATSGLGINEKLHAQIFNEIHQKKNYLLDTESQAEFLQAAGVEAAAADKALKSFTTDSQLRQAEALQRELKVPGIPCMIVKGRYMVNLGGPVRTYDDMLKIVDYLLDK